MRQVILDCETTGKSPEEGHRIIEIGCVELINRNIGNNYSQLINPERSSDLEALRIHKISDAQLTDKPRFIEIWDALAEFIKDSELIMHNAGFDVSFLDAELKLMKRGSLVDEANCRVVDTLQMARSLYPGLGNSLNALCNRFKISKASREERHGALIDAELLTKVYLAMTGGQGMMSFTDSNEASDEQINISRKEANLKVVYADQNELKEHEKLINQLNQLSGKPVLWTK